MDSVFLLILMIAITSELIKNYTGQNCPFQILRVNDFLLVRPSNFVRRNWNPLVNNRDFSREAWIVFLILITAILI